MTETDPRHNDMQRHLLAKIARLAQERRDQARQLVDAIIDAHELGIPADEIAEDVFRNMVEARRS